MEPEKNSNGAVVGLVIIIIILVLGGIYMWSLDKKPVEDINSTEQTTQDKTVEDINSTEQTTQDKTVEDINSLEAEINSTNSSTEVDAEAVY